MCKILSCSVTKTRQVRCYFYLLAWIILFTAGLYILLSRFGNTNKTKALQPTSVRKQSADGELYEADDASEVHSDEGPVGTGRTQPSRWSPPTPPPLSSIERLCNPTKLIRAKHEYLSDPDFKLEAVIILFRHGDRGPLAHIGRNVSHINCYESHPEYLELVKYANEVMPRQPGYFSFIGPFHSFPKVPTGSGSGCSLGQLTTGGVIQLLTLGKLIRTTYGESGLFGNLTNVLPSLMNVKITAYSTRYRRTFQSLIAFLYGLIGGPNLIPSVTIHESQSTSFCFNHCSCRASVGLKKAALKRSTLDSTDKASLNKLVSELNYLLGMGKVKKSGASLLDSLLVYPCHHSPLPCRRSKPKSKSHVYSCVTPAQLQSLKHLIEKESEGIKETIENHQNALLTSYGLIKEILNLSLRMTSSSPNKGSKSRLAIFSGHDKTIQGLLDALGVNRGHADLYLPPYASRLVIEIYRKATLPNHSPRKHFLRFLYNGVSITHLVGLCSNSLVEVKDQPELELCPLESYVKFFHDSYFDPFPKSVVNFKDACQ